MLETKYEKLLTIILSIVVIAVLILLGFLGYDVAKKYSTKKTVAEVLNKFDDSIENNEDQNNSTVENVTVSNVEVDNANNSNNSNSSNGSGKTIQFQGYNVVGKMEIPAIDLEYHILEKATPSSIEAALAVQYTANGLNEVGNTLIVGHNYRNGSFFGSNDKLQLGDKVYITDTTGRRIKYNIYNIYETSPEDGDFIMRDTNGKREVSLSTCTDNSKARLIIWAVEE
jgi:sortase family protein